MKKKYSVTNFAQGINEYANNGAADIQNFDVTNDGALVTRDGWGDAANAEALGGIVSSETVKQSFFANGYMFVQTDGDLYYRNSADTFQACNNSSGLDATELNTACSERWSVVVADNNRVFLTNTQAKGQLWVDTSGTPTLYKWGIDAPSIGSFSSGSGSGPEEGEYAYAFAYEGKYGAMSPLSERRVYTHSSDGPVSITLPSASGLDAQIEKIVIYRTEKSTPVTFADGQQYEEVLAKNAPLKQIGTVAKASMGSGYSDITTSIGLAPLAGQLEGAAKPPNLLTNITLYGGRIWGCVNGTNKLVFSALDETAAPLYDIFPDESSPVPHVVNVKDRITGIGASRDYLSVFSQNSIQLVRGQGVISGIYGKSQPGTDLDLSQYLTAMGAKDERCIAEALGNVYFYCDIDLRVYRIDKDGNVTWVSQPVQELLDSLESGSSNIEQVIAHGGTVYLLRRDGNLSSLLKYDQLRNLWTHHSLGSSAKIESLSVNDRSASTDTFESGLYGMQITSTTNRSVVRLFVDGVTTDDGNAITATYTSQEFSFPSPTRLDAVRVGVEGSATVVVTATADNSSIVTPSSGSLTLNKNNNYTVRTFARGYKHQVKFQLTSAQTVRFFELQFRSR
tara:strand:- start:54 stop:1919 length:1866 start_codon:yes stop_codon:yes gene_type:complete